MLGWNLDDWATGQQPIDLVSKIRMVFGLQMDESMESGMVVSALWCLISESWLFTTKIIVQKIWPCLLTSGKDTVDGQTHER